MSRETVLRICSVLLEYPDADTLAATPALRAAAAREGGTAGRALLAFLDRRAAQDEWVTAEEYVATFDFHKRASLHLSYYRDGDRRQRGATLLGLKRRYREAGFELTGGELPDYLPAMLEFAALAPGGDADAILARMRPGIELLRATLHELDSAYAQVLDAATAVLPSLTAEELAEARRIAAEGPPDEEVGLEPFAPPEVMPVAGVVR
ncbi:MAG: nitrate reductase molybdenum cofactor assembly chaperone [Solirubrobacteraceae bacterium]|jgi:nitrate reductase delta subunit|nr:nitrate reductase molybdenum cofactor assembly chaperone [Solirubrobacteraceae bacterium]